MKCLFVECDTEAAFLVVDDQELDPISREFYACEEHLGAMCLRPSGCEPFSVTPIWSPPESDWTSVESSNVDAVRYTSNALEVRFKNGGTYRYADVPEQTYRDLLDSPSVGRFLASYVKPRFKAEKVTL